MEITSCYRVATLNRPQYLTWAIESRPMMKHMQLQLHQTLEQQHDQLFNSYQPMVKLRDQSALEKKSASRQTLILTVKISTSTVRQSLQWFSQDSHVTKKYASILSQTTTQYGKFSRVKVYSRPVLVNQSWHQKRSCSHIQAPTNSSQMTTLITEMILETKLRSLLGLLQPRARHKCSLVNTMEKKSEKITQNQCLQPIIGQLNSLLNHLQLNLLQRHHVMMEHK